MIAGAIAALLALMELCEKDDEKVCEECQFYNICMKRTMNIDEKDSNKRH